MVKKIWIFLLGVMLLTSCQSNDARNYREYLQEKPTKTHCYQIQQQGSTIGYAHKYSWQTLRNDYYFYFVYDVRNNLVGHIGGNGNTKKYLANGTTENIGNFTLKTGAEQIFNSPTELRIFTVQAQDVPMPKVAKFSNLRSTTPKKATTKPITKDDSEEAVSEYDEDIYDEDYDDEGDENGENETQEWSTEDDEDYSDWPQPE